SACYGAIYNLSDKIANYYYQKAMNALKEVEQRLLLMISQLQDQINMLQAKIKRIESTMTFKR
ncbi:MAG: hypothetical protein QW425_03595, partial [Desulfurococcaceae archaeon]